MKKIVALCIAIILLMCSGCSFKVKKNTFSIPTENVSVVTFQKRCVDETGKNYYIEKNVTEKKDIKTICEKVQTTPMKRADTTVPQPIDDVDFVIIIKSGIKYHIILNEKKAFYDQVAYEYVSKKTYNEYSSLYNSLNYEEKTTEVDLY